MKTKLLLGFTIILLASCFTTKKTNFKTFTSAQQTLINQNNNKMINKRTIYRNILAIAFSTLFTSTSLASVSIDKIKNPDLISQSWVLI